MTESGKLGPEKSIAGMRILIVEDEMMVAMMLEDMLTDLGCEVVKAARVAKAVHLIATTAIDGAILDVNVAGEAVYPVAHELQSRGIPFIFSLSSRVVMAPTDSQQSIAIDRHCRSPFSNTNSRRC